MGLHSTNLTEVDGRRPLLDRRLLLLLLLQVDGRPLLDRRLLLLRLRFRVLPCRGHGIGLHFHVFARQLVIGGLGAYMAHRNSGQVSRRTKVNSMKRYEDA